MDQENDNSMHGFSSHGPFDIFIAAGIIGIIAAIIIPFLINYYKNYRNYASVKIEINALTDALKNYKQDTGDYPTAEQGLRALIHNPNSADDTFYWKGPYFKKEKDENLLKDYWGNVYHYKIPGDHKNEYALWSSGRDGKSGTKDDITIRESK